MGGGFLLPKYSSLPMLVDWYSGHLYSIIWGGLYAKVYLSAKFCQLVVRAYMLYNLYESFYSHCFCCSGCYCCPYVIIYTKNNNNMKSLGEEEQQQKLKIYINCFILISNRCMTYLSKSWTPNDSIYSFTHCKAVMKLTVLNGLSLQTFIS